ncbi:MAG: divalent-cation tolerance protein CutA [Actinomycetota bacterium]
MIEPNQLVSVSITGPGDFLAGLTASLVRARLAACGNIQPAIRSIYVWDGAIEDDTEALVTLHTTYRHVDAIIERTNLAHPYDTAQILATEIVAADTDYAAWVVAETMTD